MVDIHSSLKPPSEEGGGLRMQDGGSRKHIFCFIQQGNSQKNLPKKSLATPNFTKK